MQLDDQTMVHRLLPIGAFTNLAYDHTLGFLKQFAIILRRPGHVASDIGQLFQPGSQLAYTGDKIQQQNPGPNQRKADPSIIYRMDIPIFYHSSWFYLDSFATQ